MRLILALDQGTTSSRALLVDEEGAIRAVAQREFRQIFPEPGWVEHDPLEILDSQLSVAAEVCRNLSSGDVLAGIGITNQRETTILWDRKTGRPLSNAIVWQDRRTATMCEDLSREGHAETFRQKTGLVLDPYFSGTKLRWLLDHVDGAAQRALRGELAFGTVDSWLVWHLTGGAKHVTDPSNASRTLLYDIHRHEWDDELLGILVIHRSLLPSVRPTSSIFGETSCEALPPGIPIASMAGDQQAALFGQRCTRAGMVKTTFGTGSFIVMHTGNEPVASNSNLLTTVAWQRDGITEYASEGSIFVAGALVQWLRDGLGLIRSSSEIEALAATVPDTGGIYLVPAFTGLGAPHWDARARGAIVGLTRGTTRAHIARAALEAMAFQVAEVVLAMERDSGLPVQEMRVDGGATVNDLLMQFQADILGVPVVRSSSPEATALGAAYLAGLTTGVWKSDADLDRLWQREKSYTPRISSEERERRIAEWSKAVERSRDWA